MSGCPFRYWWIAMFSAHQESGYLGELKVDASFLIAASPILMASLLWDVFLRVLNQVFIKVVK